MSGSGVQSSGFRVLGLVLRSRSGFSFRALVPVPMFLFHELRTRTENQNPEPGTRTPNSEPRTRSRLCRLEAVHERRLQRPRRLLIAHLQEVGRVEGFVGPVVVVLRVVAG